MAKRTPTAAEAAAATAETNRNTIELAAHFKSYSVPNDEKCTIGVRVEAGKLTPTQARKFFCGARINAELKLGDPKQLEFDGMEGAPLAAVADVKSFNTSPKYVSFTLHMSRDENAGQDMAKFVNSDGMLRAMRMGPAGGDKPDSDAGGNTKSLLDGDDDDEN